MKKCYYKKTLIGIKITSFAKGSIPQTNPKESLGMLTIKLPKKTQIPAHIHKSVKKITYGSQECLIMKKGKIKIDLFGPDKKFFKSLLLKTGELFMVVSGGHKITVLEACEMFVIKNGPFKEDKIFI